MARVVHPKQHWASHWVRCGPMLGAQRLCGLRVGGNFRIPCSFSHPADAQCYCHTSLGRRIIKKRSQRSRACPPYSELHAVGCIKPIRIALRQSWAPNPQRSRSSASRVFVGGRLGLRSMFRRRATTSVSLHFRSGKAEGRGFAARKCRCAE